MAPEPRLTEAGYAGREQIPASPIKNQNCLLRGVRKSLLSDHPFYSFLQIILRFRFPIELSVVHVIIKYNTIISRFFYEIVI